MNNSNRILEGRNIVITGAGSGIGKACAILMARAGGRVALIGQTSDNLLEVMKELGGNEAGHFAIEADVSNEIEMIAAAESISAHWSHVDAVVANAGINGVWAPLDEIGVHEWDRTLGVNLRGTFLTTKVTLPLLRRKGGAVIVISSINGTRVFSNSGATAYSCSKAAQIAFVKMTALELAKDNIRVNAVCPGSIKTNIDESTESRNLDHLHLSVEFPEGDVPLTEGRPGSAHQVAELVLFLASDAANHITGSQVFIDGGQSLLQG